MKSVRVMWVVVTENAFCRIIRAGKDVRKRSRHNLRMRHDLELSSLVRHYMLKLNIKATI